MKSAALEKLIACLRHQKTIGVGAFLPFFAFHKDFQCSFHNIISLHDNENFLLVILTFMIVHDANMIAWH